MFHPNLEIKVCSVEAVSAQFLTLTFNFDSSGMGVGDLKFGGLQA